MRASQPGVYERKAALDRTCAPDSECKRQCRRPGGELGKLQLPVCSLQSRSPSFKGSFHPPPPLLSVTSLLHVYTVVYEVGRSHHDITHLLASTHCEGQGLVQQSDYLAAS